jgi:hypothetical protein
MAAVAAYLRTAENSSVGEVMLTPISKQRNKHMQTILADAAKSMPRYSSNLALVRDCEMQGGNRNRVALAFRFQEAHSVDHYLPLYA